MSNMINHFEQEVELMGWNDQNNFKNKDGYEMQQTIVKNVKDVLKVISEQGHSGFSMGYFRKILNNAIDFKPIGPLTGKDDEWGEPFDEVGTRQNKRDGNVFLDSDGTARTINGYVFEDESGGRYTCLYSNKNIEFPYTPKDPVVLKVPNHKDEEYEIVHKTAINEYELQQEKENK